MQQQRTLDGMSDTARLELEVLLGPDAHVMHIRVTVTDPIGRLLAQRSWPIAEQDSPSDKLDLAWRALLMAMPPESFVRRQAQRGNNKTSRNHPARSGNHESDR